MRRASQQSGFTIVELLIVVVVIAILAAITIVSYNGITKRASESVVKSAISTAQKKLATHMVDNAESYPVNLSDTGIKDDGTITYQYTGNNTTTPKGYCVTATSTNGTMFYFANNFVPFGSSDPPVTSSTATSGACPDHIAPGVTMTNYVPNSSVGSGISGYSGPNSTAIVRSTERGYSGPSSVEVTLPQGAHSTLGVLFYSVGNVATVLTPGMTYTVSAWVWVPSTTVNVRMSIQGAGKTDVGNYSQRIATDKDQWVRIYDKFVAASSGSIQFYILNETATPTANTKFWADAFMINQTNQPAKFANGNTPGWSWSGTPELSASSGPAL